MNQLAKYQGFKAKLAIAETFDEIKLIESKASAVAEFANKNKIGIREQNEWGKFRVEIEAKKGTWLSEKFPAGGDRKSSSPLVSLIKQGITFKESSDARLVAKETALVEEVMAEIESKGDVITPTKVASEVRKKKRKENITQIKQQIPKHPLGLFDVIVVDPPWPYGTNYDDKGRRAASPYPEQSLEEIKQMKIPATDNCILWFWTTHKFMRYSFDILDYWGFRDVAILTWVKNKMGLGQWLRSQSEFCIMAIKGKPIIDLKNQTTIIHGTVREHSRKPDEFYAMIESLCVGNKIDYYSREKREGWFQFGNESERF